LHRAGGLWVWGMLLILAVSGVAMNLPDQVFRPVLAWVSPLQPSYAALAVQRAVRPREPVIGFDAALRIALVHQPRSRPTGVFHDSGLYGVGLARASTDGENGLGPTYLYLDDRNGRLMQISGPRDGSVGDRFAALQFQLHSGRILGLGGRIFVSFLGLMVAMLSITGVVIWWKKRRSRVENRRSW
jgi:uncharacterized iron-regulated membrane protein